MRPRPRPTFAGVNPTRSPQRAYASHCTKHLCQRARARARETRKVPALPEEENTWQIVKVFTWSLQPRGAALVLAEGASRF